MTMTTGLYNSNLQIVKRIDSSLESTLSSSFHSASHLEYEILFGANQLPTIHVAVQGHATYLHSRYDPVNEAKRWSEAQMPPKGSVVVFLGWGMGYHVLEWIKRFRKDVEGIIIVEPEGVFFQESLHHVDLQPLKDSSRIDIVLGTSGEELYQILLKHMEYILSGDLHVIPLPFAAVYPKEFFVTVKAEIQKLMAAKEQMLQHMAKQGFRCQENCIRNLPNIAQCLFPHNLSCRLNNQPAIIVAAGPSLDRNIDVLQAAQNRAWIFAVDTSLRILKEGGIKAQIVVTKDPTDNNRHHFEGMENLQSPVLAFDPQVMPDIPQRFIGPKICLPNRNNAVHRYIRGLELNENDELPLSTNVAVAAFNMASLMGCNPIVFVGLDLCFSDTMGASHAAGSALTAETAYSPATGTMTYARGGAKDSVGMMTVEGIDGKSYPTHSTFYEALRLLESIIQSSSKQVIDASEGGAKIAGTRIMTLRETLDQHCNNSIHPSDLVQLKYPQRNVEDIRRSITAIATHVRQCGEIAHKALDDLPNSALNALQTIEDGYRLYHELQSALERLMVEISRPNFWDDSLPHDELMKRYKWYFTEIANACKSFTQLYEEAAENVKHLSV